MKLYRVGERFFQEFTLRQVLLNRSETGDVQGEMAVSLQVSP
jgi:hypothetical protein